MINEIREYIEGIILEVDPEMRRHEQAFTSENIPSTVINKAFFIAFERMNFFRDDTAIEVTIPVSVELFNRLFNKPVENFDEGLCRSLDVLARITDQKRIDQNGFIKAINTANITPEAIENDDNAAKYTIELTITAYFSGE